MPAKDTCHDAVKNALIKDGWTITIDTCPLEYEDVELYPDLAIEKIISENQKQRKIIVEITSFISSSLIKDFQNALGQYILYRDLIQLAQDEYQEIYLAIKDEIHETFFRNDWQVQLNAIVVKNLHTQAIGGTVFLKNNNIQQDFWQEYHQHPEEIYSLIHQPSFDTADSTPQPFVYHIHLQNTSAWPAD